MIEILPDGGVGEPSLPALVIAILETKLELERRQPVEHAGPRQSLGPFLEFLQLVHVDLVHSGCRTYGEAGLRAKGTLPKVNISRAHPPGTPRIHRSSCERERGRPSSGSGPISLDWAPRAKL